MHCRSGYVCIGRMGGQVGMKATRQAGMHACRQGVWYACRYVDRLDRFG